MREAGIELASFALSIAPSVKDCINGYVIEVDLSQGPREHVLCNLWLIIIGLIESSLRRTRSSQHSVLINCASLLLEWI